MNDIITAIVSSLNNAQNEVTVYCGYPAGFAKAPLNTKSAYVYAGKISCGTMTFSAAVYTPVSGGGSECSAAAELLLQSMLGDELLPLIVSAEIGEVSYDAHTKCFKAKIEGELYAPGETRYFFAAHRFEKTPAVYISCRIPGYTIKREFGARPVSEIFSPIPCGLCDDVTRYEITLRSVPYEYAEQMSRGGRFVLNLENGDFTDCRCVESLEDQTGFCDLKVRGLLYSDEPGTVTPIIPDQ